jgi:hypothetical protein
MNKHEWTLDTSHTWNTVLETVGVALSDDVNIALERRTIRATLAE